MEAGRCPGPRVRAGGPGPPAACARRRGTGASRTDAAEPRRAVRRDDAGADAADGRDRRPVGPVRVGLGRRQPARQAADGVDRAAGRRSRRARSGCGSGRPAWPASRCATRSCWPTSGPASTCWPRAAPSWSPAPASCRRRAAGSRAQLYGRHEPKDRAGRLVEWITLLKRLWTEDNVTLRGRALPLREHHDRAEAGRQAAPADLDRQQRRRQPDAVDRAHPPPGRRPRRRLGDLALGSGRPALADRATSANGRRGRPRPGALETHLYHNINVNEDREAALDESKRFLDVYYTMDFPPARVDGWTAAGSPDECVEHLRVYEGDGVRRGHAAHHRLGPVRPARAGDAGGPAAAAPLSAGAPRRPLPAAACPPRVPGVVRP